MPSVFHKQLSKCVCTIDRFEVFCEKPSNLMVRAQTHSNYKSHNTAKFLIALTPWGFISYLSQAWGGRTTDKHLTKYCGLLKLLLPGNEVLADSGFTV